MNKLIFIGSLLSSILATNLGEIFVKPQQLQDFDYEVCERTEDCPLAPFNICVDEKCEHKGVFPMQESEICGIFVLTALTVLANVGGIGGGGIIIPVTIAMFGFSTKEAIALSGALIYSGSLARFAMQINEKHPQKDSTLIEYNIVILMLPLVLMGSFLGVLVNVMTPNIILSSFLTLILIIFAFRSWLNASKLHKKETAKASEEDQQIKVQEKSDHVQPQNDQIVTEEDQKSLLELETREKSHLMQWRKHLLALIAVSLSLAVNLVRGSTKEPSLIGIKRCSDQDWAIFASYIGVSFILTYLASLIVKREQAQKLKAGKIQNDSEISLNQSLKPLLIFSFIGGLISGAFGLGGGSIFNPLLIEMGVPPSVSAATGMYMVMLSSLATSVMYASYGALDFEYSAWLSMWSVLGLFYSLGYLSDYIKKHNRQSIIVYLMTAILGASALLVPVFALIEAYQEMSRDHDILKFEDICK